MLHLNLETKHWRLLWEDKRYTDGVIPDESEYFLEGPQQNRDIVA
ncbi:hypothetical protein LGM14_27240 [Burkholderia multivorans]|nr:hypothetical protein [Burkholderia multivorans]MDN7597919.1 Imm72 family immunity protein [Burkholderia multivorans]